jgi:hypothetical protein
VKGKKIMNGNGREKNKRRIYQFCIGASALCISVILIGGCASTKDVKPKYLAVPITYERHRAAVCNCKPVGVVTNADYQVPNEENLLGLVFPLERSSESSSKNTSGTGGSVWTETSSSRNGVCAVRLFKCPSEFLQKIRAEMKGDTK